MFLKTVNEGSHAVVPKLDHSIVQGCKYPRSLGMKREAFDSGWHIFSIHILFTCSSTPVRPCFKLGQHQAFNSDSPKTMGFVSAFFDPPFFSRGNVSLPAKCGVWSCCCEWCMPDDVQVHDLCFWWGSFSHQIWAQRTSFRGWRAQVSFTNCSWTIFPRDVQSGPEQTRDDPLNFLLHMFTGALLCCTSTRQFSNKECRWEIAWCWSCTEYYLKQRWVCEMSFTRGRN